MMDYATFAGVIIQGGLLDKDIKIPESMLQHPPEVEVTYTKDLKDGSTIVRFQRRGANG